MSCNRKGLIEKIRGGAFDDSFSLLYGREARTLDFQKKRYEKCLEDFCEIFGDSDGISLLSVPGRSEVGGNHTDHNNGRVLACAVDLDCIAAVRCHPGGVIRIQSEGFPMDTVDLSKLNPGEDEHFKSSALIRGVCARLKALGYDIGEGFDAFTTSRVLKGSGLSSSAAFEVMVANIISALYNNGRISPVVMAKASQYAEREYFGKPCGLMDQTACAVGGFIAIDFADTERPKIEKLDFDFAKTGHTLCIVDTAGSHSDLNADYASIQGEMRQVARIMGHSVLRECGEKEFYRRIPEIRKAVGDRAVLRAVHFFGDNERVAKQAEALRAGDFEAFKSLVIESGRSSFMYLQNVYSAKTPGQQGLSLALALSERILSGFGAWRVHGGGFAGTIQAFVPKDKLEEYVSVMNGVFGENACYRLNVRPVGAYRMESGED